MSEQSNIYMLHAGQSMPQGALCDALRKVIDEHADRNQLTWIDVAGVLEVLKFAYITQAGRASCD